MVEKEGGAYEYGVRLTGPKSLSKSYIRRCDTLSGAAMEAEFFNKIDSDFGAIILKRKAAVIIPAGEWEEADE